MLAEPLVITVMRRLAVIDAPVARSSHTTPTVRGGGVAVAIGAVAGLCSPGRGFAVLAPLVAVVAFAAIGLREDVRGVRPAARFALQLTAAALVVSLVLIRSDLGRTTGALLGVVGVLWVVSFVNAFNFMDGVNGISAAQTAVAGAYYLWLGHDAGLRSLELSGLVAVAVAVGFLPWNFPRARVFLGDVGSYALGGLLAVVALTAVAARIRVDAAVAPLLLYLGDTGVTLVRRARAGETWYLPHRSHAYQRLALVGWSHPAITAAAATVVALCSVCGTVTATAPWWAGALADGVAVGATVAFLLLPGALRRLGVRRVEPAA